MRMKEFEEDDKHKTSHKGIHDGASAPRPCHSLPLTMLRAGLDKLSELILKWRADPTAYSPAELRACLDGWRDVLFRHLDEEV